MAKIDNLRINGEEVKHIYIKLKKNSKWQELKEFFFNDILIWKNANPFIFTKSLASIDLSTLSEDTIIFEGFSELEFTGLYNIVENASLESEGLSPGQMVVETTEGDN